ncbi:hypothetical protein RIF29_21236 [Crotalaria pallida]|uniref:Uncharacterized protein n=1 Tax=Crotalaria pallida TaxID=3830 RepID=A0AAN9F461_CROPI
MALEEKRGNAETNPMADSVPTAFFDDIPNMMMSDVDNNTTFITFPFSSTTNTNSIFDMMPPSSSSSSSCDPKSSSFGTSFMDLLTVDDYNNTFLFDYCLPSTITTTTTTQIDHHPLPSPVDGSELPNTLASPNSTSILSSSHEATTTPNSS